MPSQSSSSGSSSGSDNLIDDFTKHFAKYKKLASNRTLPIELTFEGVPKPFLVHSSAIKRLKRTNNVYDKSMIILIPPDYDRPIHITDSYTEKFKLSGKYASLKVANKEHPVIKVTYEFIEWIADISKEIKSFPTTNQPVKLPELPGELHQKIADELPPRSVIALRHTAKALHKNIKKPKKLSIHKFDGRKYLLRHTLSELNLDSIYLPNEAKVLYLAEEVKPDYLFNKYLTDEDHEKIRPTILASGASEGDIIFAGSSSYRQEYGFYLKTNTDYVFLEEIYYYYRADGVVKYAKEKYPSKNYDNALKILYAMEKQYLFS
jgi:hypothetical protein